MLDRLKGARSDQTETEDRKRDEAKVEAGMPRFLPQPGGFGRRATPVDANPGGANPGGATSVGGAPAAVSAPDPKPVEAEAPANSGENSGVNSSANPQPRFRKPDQSPGGSEGGTVGWARHAPANAAPVLGDIPTRIADWLMRELKDGRGVHCETMLTAVGALAGYAAQQSLWEGMVKPGKLAISQAFKVVETPSGGSYFFGNPLDAILASVEPKHQSIWKIVAGGALSGGGEHLPDIGNLFRHCEATAGTSQFGLPRLPDDHLPGMLPREALERFWPGARLLLALAEPLTWPVHMAHAAQKLMLAMKGSIAPDLAVKIVMEAAVPMSRVDPMTVPNN